MTESKPIDVGRSLANVWGKLMMQKQYNSALLMGFLSYLVSLETQDAELKVGAISWIERAMQEFMEAQNDQTRQKAGSSHSCSFCGRREPEIRLAAGAGAYICDSCVATLSETFAAGKGSDDQT